MKKPNNVIVTNTVDSGNLARELNSFPKDHPEFDVIHFNVTSLHSTQFLVSFLCEPRNPGPSEGKSKKQKPKKGRSGK